MLLKYGGTSVERRPRGVTEPVVRGCQRPPGMGRGARRTLPSARGNAARQCGQPDLEPGWSAGGWAFRQRDLRERGGSVRPDGGLDRELFAAAAGVWDDCAVHGFGACEAKLNLRSLASRAMSLE